MRLAKTCKVDQIKAKLFLTVDELGGLARDDYVLGTASGKRFQVEFQRLSRVDPSLEPLIENGETVELVLVVVVSPAAAAARSSLGGTPVVTRRKLGPAVKEAAFSTPQAPRKSLGVSPRNFLLGAKSPRNEGGPPEDSQTSKARQQREAALKEKEAELQRKKERLEEERRAEEERKWREEERVRKEAEEASERQRQRERDRQSREEAAKREEERRQQEIRRKQVEEHEERLREKREQLEAKKRQRESAATAEELAERQERRRQDEADAAAQLRALELRQRELEVLSANRGDEVARERLADSQERDSFRKNDLEAEALRREEKIAEDRMVELERKQLERDKMALLNEQAANAEVERQERKAEARRRAEMAKQEAEVAEELRKMETERKQRERDRLALEAQTSSPDTDDTKSDKSDVSEDDARKREAQALLDKKRQEVIEKRAELERKMREVEERQREIERRRREQEEVERLAAAEQERKRQEEVAQWLAETAKRDAELEAAREKESKWEKLREMQIAEENKRAQLSAERLRHEEERAEKERQAVIEEEQRKRHEEEEALRKQKIAEAAEELRKWKLAQAEEEKIATEEAKKKKEADAHVFAASMPVLPIKLTDDGPVAPPPAVVVDKPIAGSSSSSPSMRKKHQRTGSFGFLKSSEKVKPQPNPDVQRVGGSAGAASDKKGTPLLSRISLGVKGVRSVLVQRRNSFRNSKPAGKGEQSSGPYDFPFADEIAEEDDAAIAALSQEAVKRCAKELDRAEQDKSALRDLTLALVAGKQQSFRLEYCLDNKFYWIEGMYSDFEDGWNHPNNLLLMLPHLDDSVYAKRIRRGPHKNYFAIDEKAGPVVITNSLEPDESGDYCHIFWSESGLREFKIAGSLYDELPNGSDLKQRLRLVQKVLETTFSVSPATKLTLAVRESFDDELDTMEQSLHSSNHKFGVLYAKEGQNQNEMFGNKTPSAQFDRFLALLGDRVALQGFAGFRGGLDVKHGHTGSESVFTKFAMHGGAKEVEFDVMFHVSTMLPYSETDAQQLERKRHLGNDIVVVVFMEGDGSVPYDPNVLKSEFNHAFIIVQPIDGGKRYRVHCIYKSGVPECNPFMPGPDAVFDHGPEFRAWLLAKCVNAERVSCQCVTFSQKLRRTRRLQTQMLVNSALEESEKANK